METRVDHIQRYGDRHEAGLVLAARLKEFADRPNVVVLALPRGGVPVAYPIAQKLAAPLDVHLVRKLGAPGHPELAMGAIDEHGGRVLNDEVVRGWQIGSEVIEDVTRRETERLREQAEAYRAGREPEAVEGRIVIVVDDGLATGSSMLAAVRSLKERKPERLIVAVPVAPASTIRAFKEEGYDVVCGIIPAGFMAVGEWYRDFNQVSDEEVRHLLSDSRKAA